MPRVIPIALQQHLDSGTTTLCVCVQIEPVSPGYSTLGVTSLDRPLIFDGVTYHAAVGLDASNRLTTSDMSVDNSEGTALVPEFDLPISESDLIAGAYDYARWTSYLVNYGDVDQRVEMGAGSLGQVRVIEGLSFTFELLGLTKQLMQSIVEKDSLRCRASFGSQPGEERFPCEFQTDGLWEPGTVTGVGEEINISFATSLAKPDGFFKPGLLRWLTGANAGRQYEVESYEAAAASLMFPTMFPVQPGDEFEIRPDCTKWKDDANGCKAWWGGDWVLHYRGEPYIPVGDTGQVNAPGASI